MGKIVSEVAGALVKIVMPDISGVTSLAFARNMIIRNLAGTGITGEKALSIMRSMITPSFPGGIGMRIQNFYRLWDTFKEEAEKKGRGSQVKPDSYPGSRAMTDSPFKQQTKYRYETVVSYTDIETGKTHEQWITVNSSRRLTRQEIEETAQATWYYMGTYKESAGEFMTARFSHGFIMKKK